MKLEDENYIPASEIATCSWDSAIALAADNQQDSDDSWWVDSGCSQHMSGDEDDFIEIEELERQVDVGRQELYPCCWKR